jgi:hypothetical protein
MRIYPINQAKVVPEDVVFRQSRGWMVVAMVLTAVFPAVGVIMLWSGGGKVFPWYVIIVGALLLLFALWKAAGVFSAENWVVRVLGQRILIKIGPPSSDEPARVFVAEFQAKEFEWVRAHGRVTKTREPDGVAVSSTSWLELKLRTADLTELERCIKTASAPVRSKWSAKRLPVSVSSTTPTDIPVSVTSEDVLRVEWKGKYWVLAPWLKRAVALLGKDIQVMPEVKEVQDFTKSDADKTKMEARIIELVERGEMMQAMKMARQLYGFSLKEAKDFVEELRGKGDGKDDKLATNEHE